MNSLYQDLLMDHYRHPRNKGILQAPDAQSELHNPSCGDSVSFQVNINNDCISAIAFDGQGCVLSLATASLISEQAKGQSLDTILSWDKNKVMQLVGMELGPVRIKCALLPLQALQESIVKYQKAYARA